MACCATCSVCVCMCVRARVRVHACVCVQVGLRFYPPRLALTKGLGDTCCARLPAPAPSRTLAHAKSFTHVGTCKILHAR